ncbi:MAG: DUF433 domain-containing protein [Candidatus Phosphoribacter baldrii]|jgi:uncharacterized protein (DUF433 family)|nr:DUF433 domain-containing protein [Candidatus Phosphoribacter baldrii]MBK6954092.1 DUF433 domain-containing protein [Candidatus Phosphoribacter baldrii]
MDVDYAEPRFVTPICTVQDVADLVGMPLDTVKAWAGQRSSRRQMFTRTPQDHRGWPSVPLVGLVEANTLRTLREMLAPSEVEAAALWIRQRFDAPFALANKRLVTDGAYAYVKENPSELYRVKTSQHAFVEVLEDHLKPLIFEADDYPVAFEVRIPGVAIDPRFNAGRMTYIRNRVPVFAILGSLAGGDSVDEVMQQYGLTLQEVAAVDEHREWAATAA